MKDYDATEQAFKNGYEKGKQEVAREILQEIKPLIPKNTNGDYEGFPTCFYVINEIEERIAELEKKYIGEKK